MFLDASPNGVTLRQTDKREKAAIFDIETWHEISHPISQQESVRSRPSRDRPRQIWTGNLDLNPPAILQEDNPQDIVL